MSASRVAEGVYEHRGVRITRCSPAARSPYPWVIEWPYGSLSDVPLLLDAVSLIDTIGENRRQGATR